MNKKLLGLSIFLIIIFAVSCNKDKNEKTDDKTYMTVTPYITQDDNSEDIVSTAPSLDENISAQETGKYVFICIDQNNAPVKGVKIQICTEETCMMKESDENGEVRFDEEPYQYDIHVYSVPKEYELVSQKDFKTEAKYGTYKILLAGK